MPTALEFKINLAGNFASVLGESNKELGKTGEHAKHAKHELELFEGEVGNLKGEMGGLGLNFSALAKGGSFFTFDLAEGIKTAIELVHKLVETFVDLGKEMVGVAAKTQDLNLAIKLDVGEERAENINKLAESLQEQTRFSAAQIKGALLPLLEQGLIADDQLTDVTAAATDLAARRNKGIEGVHAALGAFQDIAINPQRMRGALKELQIRQADYFKDLGQLMGVTADQAKALAEKGKVQTKTLISVALNQIQQRQGGSLGAPTMASARTLGGTLERLGNLKENLFERVADSPGMAKIQGFLDNFIDIMGGPLGTELVQKLSSVFESLFGDLSGPDGAQKLEDEIRIIVKTIGDLVDGFRAAWPDIKEGAVAVYQVFRDIASATASVAAHWNELKSGVKIVAGIATQNPGDVVSGVTGLFGGEKKSAAPEQQAAGALGDAMAASVAAAAPHMASGGIVSRPTMALIGESGPEAVMPLSKISSGKTATITFAPVFQLSSSGSAEASRDLLEEAEQTVRFAFKKILDEMDYTIGFTQPGSGQRDTT